MITTNQIIEKIKNAKNIAIFAHRNPDPDACASMFALEDLCQNLGKNGQIFVAKREENYLDKIFPLSKTRADFNVCDFDLIMFVDMHQTMRLDKNLVPDADNVFKKAQNLVIVDHHVVQKDDIIPTEDYYIRVEASCSQLILELFQAAHITPSKQVCTYLYAGLMGDTNRFLNTNLNLNVFNCASYLMQNGADIQFVYNFMYRYKTKEELAVYKYYLDNIHFACDGRCAFVTFSKETQRKLGVTIEDIKSLAGELILIKGVEVTFLIIEYFDGVYKFSLRCLQDHAVDGFCAKHGGGGHRNASGFEAEITPAQIEEVVPKWADEILNDKI